MMLISRCNRQLILIQFLIILIALPIILFDGSIDAFAPIHVLNIELLTTYGHGGLDFLDRTPGFYSFCASLSILLNISPSELIFYPFQLLAWISMLLIIFYKISNNIFFAGIVSLIYIISDTSGNKFFLWPHFLGDIILYIMIFTIILLFKSKTNRIYYSIIIFLTISEISLVLISYNTTLIVGLLLFFISIITIIIKNKIAFNDYNNFKIINMILKYNMIIIIILLLGISTFFYNIFIGQISQYSLFEEGVLVGLSKIVTSYFRPGYYDITISDMYYIYPSSLGILSAIKYIILIFILICSLIFVYNKYRRNLIDSYKIIFLAITMAMGSFALIRSNLGYLSIGSIVVPALLGLCIIFYDTNINKNILNIVRLKSLVILSILLILLISASIFYVSYDSKSFNSDDNKYLYAQTPSIWFEKNKKQEYVAMSDVLTRSLFVMYTAENIVNNDQQINSTQDFVYDNFWVLDGYYGTNELESLVGKVPPAARYNHYYIINNNLDIITLERWITIKPWNDDSYNINTNENIILIYSCNNINICASNNI